MRGRRKATLVRGVTLLTVTTQEQKNTNRRKIDRCLNCTKPVSECHGDWRFKGAKE